MKLLKARTPYSQDNQLSGSHMQSCNRKSESPAELQITCLVPASIGLHAHRKSSSLQLLTYLEATHVDSFRQKSFACDVVHQRSRISIAAPWPILQNLGNMCRLHYTVVVCSGAEPGIGTIPYVAIMSMWMLSQTRGQPAHLPQTTLHTKAAVVAWLGSQLLKVRMHLHPENSVR